MNAKMRVSPDRAPVITPVVSHVGVTPCCTFGDKTRYLILTLGTLCLTCCISNALALNFTVICMEAAGSHVSVVENGSSLEAGPSVPSFANDSLLVSEPLFDTNERSWLFSAVAVGQILGALPLSAVTTRFGVRRAFTVYGIVSAVSTLLLPFATKLTFWLVLFIRVLEGFSMATSFPMIGAIVAEWSAIQDNGISIALMSTHLQWGPIFTMPVAGGLCASRFGWPAVYYLQGFLTLGLFALFWIFYRDTPNEHKNVSDSELVYITTGKVTKQEYEPVPYGAILKDISVWGVFVSSVGGNFGFHLMSLFGPTYLNTVLGLDTTRTGFAAAVPYVLSIAFKLVAGPLSDRCTVVGERMRIILFNSLAQGPMTMCLVLMAVLPAEQAIAIQIAFTLVSAFCGLNALGISKSVQMISQQHCHFIFSVITFIVSAVILVLPPVVGMLAPDGTPEQWSHVFLVAAGVVLSTAIFFNFTAQASPRPWVRGSGVDCERNEKPTRLECEAAFETPSITKY